MRALVSRSSRGKWNQFRAILIAALLAGVGAAGCGEQMTDSTEPTLGGEYEDEYEREEDEEEEEEDEYGDEDGYEYDKEKHKKHYYDYEGGYSADYYKVRLGKDHEENNEKYYDGRNAWNPTCGGLTHLEGDFIECKIDPVYQYPYFTYTGNHLEGEGCDQLAFHIKRYGEEFDIKSSAPIAAMCVKGGPGANCYTFKDGGTNVGVGYNAYDEEVGKNYGISHISLCVRPQPDVAVKKEAVEDTIQPGDYAAFKLKVKNKGTATAKNVVLKDKLQDHEDGEVNWKIKAVKKNGYAVHDPHQYCWLTDEAHDYKSDDLLECKFDYLEPGDKIVVKVARKATQDDCGYLPNIAYVSADNEPDKKYLKKNNKSKAKIKVECMADVAVEKTARQDKVYPGGYAAFDIKVKNVGSMTAKYVQLIDKLEGTGWYVSGDAASYCSIYDYYGKEVLKCNFGELAPGAYKHIVVKRKATEADCEDGYIKNTAKVSAYNDYNADNNSAYDKIPVKCMSDVAVEKTALQDKVYPGDYAAFKIKVKNVGSTTAKYVKLIDKLPGTGWYVGGDDASYCGIHDYYGKEVLKCNFGELAPYAYKKIVVKRKVTAADCAYGYIKNVAEVSAYNDYNADNNSDWAKIPVKCVADLKVEKEALYTPIEPGDKIGFKLKVTNVGHVAAENGKLYDKLPGTGWYLGYGAPESCSLHEYYGDTILKCDLSGLAPGAYAKVKVLRKATKYDCGWVKNVAKVKADNDYNTSNNTAYAKVEVQCADLKVEKTALDADVKPGEKLAFKITVTNQGTANATNVVLKDELPGTGWHLGYDAPSGCEIKEYYGKEVLVCTRAGLGAGGSGSVTVYRKATYDDCGTVENTAKVSADNDVDHSNNYSTAYIEVECCYYDGYYTCWDYYESDGIDGWYDQ
ncbi:DUF11 domain-containing protein [Persicimonas caeni]|uniref:DUF11 domain-containing protein n=1 Tax=Persicimonas caeni TaxID=2292766 RepID=A0A4Y6PU20_PERCE|nr:DUF11 domain-containing protein [Persicimonas caeni]QDG51834.1 DUF11 domain-containing protein [Persicimonas caeni]QED33055.1 DUF11 domain-containing protein [Persicimonas caeni]